MPSTVQMKPQQRMARRILQSSDLGDSSEQQITTVGTVDEMVDAVAVGKEFIRVVAHLDLREGRSDSRDFALNKIQTSTRAIRVSI